MAIDRKLARATVRWTLMQASLASASKPFWPDATWICAFKSGAKKAEDLMKNGERIRLKLVGALLSGTLAMFGIYLVYEKSLLPFWTGITEQRVGLIYRQSDPVFFWISVIMFGAIGLVLAGLGLYALWRVIMSRPE